MPVALITRPLLDRAPSWVLRGGGAPADLDFDFINRRFWQQGRSSAIDQLLTTSRASTGYADYSNGTWVSFANNIPRITNKGLRVEEARTNSIRNNSMQGAVTGIPGTLPTFWTAATPSNGLNRQIVATGTEKGVTYIDIRYSGTASSTNNTSIVFETNSAVAASPSQKWSSSVFLKIAGGTLPSGISISVHEFDSGSTFLRSNDVSVTSLVSTTLARVSQIVTTGASTAFVRSLLFFNYTSGATVDLTLRIGWPQLELGAVATSPIPTTNGAVTRAADIVSLKNALSFGLSRTAFAMALAPNGTATANQTMVETYLDTNNRTNLFRAVNPFATVGTTNAGIGSTTNIAIWTADTIGKVAGYYDATGNGGSFKGSAIASTVVIAAPVVTSVVFGSIAGGSDFLNGCLMRVALWQNIRVSNAELRRITS